LHGCYSTIDFPGCRIGLEIAFVGIHPQNVSGSKCNVTFIHLTLYDTFYLL